MIDSVNTDLREKLKEMITVEFGIPLEKLVPEATMESLGIDSLALIDFMFNVEDKLGIEMPDSREPLPTLGAVFAEIEKATPKAKK
ncbi:MAG: acyl carrier protein [Pseudomonadota bacterium]